MFKRLVLASLLAVAAFGAQAADRYTIDPTHTQVEFTYSHFGFSNITGRFDTVESEFLFDAQDPTQSSVKVTIPMASLSTGVEKLDAHLLNADFFDAEKFPTATFTSTAVTAAGEGQLKVAGDLTIHGVTRPVVLDVTINKIGEHPMAKTPAAGFDARTVIKRSDFGVGGYAPAVSDEVTIEITVESRLAKP
ncbi:YceI family protein [Arenimonas terrae]|jgi:polyisoprenoid-binding protein YceI|uniref:Polyisoprenoid-binding protein n=1 Tax=Arenimonas terrae TaxID=2546226 RepID=A0A5C4RQ24_9GAMM|nr:YceI family protein [Arenimonas terrae]TNJ32841.1 polyisoprenoid-binding protein [Arenimonas terrae]